MKPSLPAACGCCLIAGIAIGWLAAFRSGYPPPETSRPDSPRTSSRPHPATAASAARISRLRALADDPKLLETEMENLPATDLPALIDMLAARAGIEGLPWQERDRIKQLVDRRYEQSPEETIAWILASENPGDRRYFFQVVFESEAAKDPLRALETAERIRRETGDSISLPHEFINRMSKQGADSLVRAVALTVGQAESAGGWAPDYPVNFDFKLAADGIAGLYSRKKPFEVLRTYPCNLVAEWVRRDANAAYAWAVANDAQGRMFSSGLSDFFAGYAKVTSPADYGRFAAQAALEGELTEKSWGNALGALVENPDSTVVEAFLAEASTRRDSGEIITKLLDASVDYYSCDMLRRHLFDRLSEEQRAKYLLTAPENVRRKLGTEPER